MILHTAGAEDEGHTDEDGPRRFSTLHDLTDRAQIPLKSMGIELLAAYLVDGIEPEAARQSVRPA